ncbi:unnamed protein product [Lathyrus oleraceus]
MLMNKKHKRFRSVKAHKRTCKAGEKNTKIYIYTQREKKLQIQRIFSPSIDSSKKSLIHTIYFLLNPHFSRSVSLQLFRLPPPSPRSVIFFFSFVSRVLSWSCGLRKEKRVQHEH